GYWNRNRRRRHAACAHAMQPGGVRRYRARASVARGLAILAALRSAVIHAGLRIAGDGLVAAIGTVGEGHAMALAHQRADGLPGESGLEVDLAAIAHRRAGAGGFGRALVLDARRVAGLLQVHAEVDQVHHDLHVALRLHGSAHHAEAHPRLSVLRDEGRDDGLERALARG